MRVEDAGRGLFFMVDDDGTRVAQVRKFGDGSYDIHPGPDIHTRAAWEKIDRPTLKARENKQEVK